MVESARHGAGYRIVKVKTSKGIEELALVEPGDKSGEYGNIPASTCGCLCEESTSSSLLTTNTN